MRRRRRAGWVAVCGAAGLRGCGLWVGAGGGAVPPVLAAAQGGGGEGGRRGRAVLWGAGGGVCDWRGALGPPGRRLVEGWWSVASGRTAVPPAEPVTHLTTSPPPLTHHPPPPPPPPRRSLSSPSRCPSTSRCRRSTSSASSPTAGCSARRSCPSASGEGGALAGGRAARLPCGGVALPRGLGLCVVLIGAWAACFGLLPRAASCLHSPPPHQPYPPTHPTAQAPHPAGEVPAPQRAAGPAAAASHRAAQPAL